MQTKRNKKMLSMALCGIMTAISVILQLPVFEISLPFLIPPFIKLDFSDLPALLTAFTAGPVSGSAVCLLKNVIHLMYGSTYGIGELANALMGIAFVVPAGVIYKRFHSKKGAFLGAAAGAAVGALCSFPINLLITYPFYISAYFSGNVDTLLQMYNTIFGTDLGLNGVLVCFNIPFTFGKYMLCVAVSMLIYKPLSPIFKKFKKQC